MQWAAAAGIARDLCKIPFPHDSRNPNTGFQLFSPQIPPNFTQIPPNFTQIPPNFTQIPP
ncbi:hypothetical protein FCG17_12380 [Neisseria meningitidis]|nr:hypothetical protein [Neisseria meningitidis]